MNASNISLNMPSHFVIALGTNFHKLSYKTLATMSEYARLNESESDYGFIQKQIGSHYMRISDNDMSESDFLYNKQF